jgi:long-chain fatty acid transport protein
MSISSKSFLCYLSFILLFCASNQAKAKPAATSDLQQITAPANNSYSTAGIATSYAGSATGAHDISDSFSNAAILSDIKSNQILVGATYLHLGIYSKDNQLINDPVKYLLIENPSTIHSATNNILPSIFVAAPVNDKIVFGLAVTSPFGITTKYNPNWIGAFEAMTTKIRTTNINPSIAYKIDDPLSVAFGLQAQYINLRLTNSTSSHSGGDVYQVNSSGWDYGFNLGTKYKFNDKLAFGIGYHSKIKHRLSAKAETPNYDTAYNFKSEITTPEIITAGTSYQLNEKIQLLSDINWYRWSKTQGFTINDTHYFRSTPQYHLKDSFKYSLGINYQHNQKLVLRGGLSYETDPTTIHNRNPRTSGGDKIAIGSGFGYKTSDASQLDLAYSRLFYKNSDIGLTHFNSSDNDGSLDIISISWKYSF